MYTTLQTVHFDLYICDEFILVQTWIVKGELKKKGNFGLKRKDERGQMNEDLG